MILKDDRMRNVFPRERGKDYNHSTFCDLVICGLVGVRPRADGPFEVKPLVPASWEWFVLSNLRCHGRVYSISYDRSGTRFGKGSGLVVRAEKFCK